MEDRTNYLYHIRRNTDSDDLSKGYVGISYRPTERFKQHLRGGCNIHLDNALAKYDDVEMVIVDSGTRDDMLTKEAFLRPDKGMGWNMAAGGCVPPTWDEKVNVDEIKRSISEKLIGRDVSQETRQKLREANLGKTHTEETKRKLSEIGKAKTGSSNNNFKGWWEVDGVRYESLAIAGDATGVKWPTIRKRALSANFPEYKFVPKDES
ncbi:homing endonuclease [Vibrio phage D69]